MKSSLPQKMNYKWEKRTSSERGYEERKYGACESRKTDERRKE